MRNEGVCVGRGPGERGGTGQGAELSHGENKAYTENERERDAKIRVRAGGK